jgi:hypothetical protein
MPRYTGDGKYGCKICGKFLMRKASLIEHIAALHEDDSKKLRCPIDGCGYKNIRRGNINIHLMTAHGLNLPVIRCFSKGCKMSKRREEGLIKHMRVCKHKPRFNTIRCQIEGCRTEVLSFNGLRNHMEIYHSKNNNFCSVEELMKSSVKYFFE